MFERISRYYEIENAKLRVADADGTVPEVAYKRRRFIPPPSNLSAVVEHTFTQGERLDLIAAAYLDDPTQFWRICDANAVMHPAELEERVGRRIVIAVPTK
jgi:hypothetical protein